MDNSNHTIFVVDDHEAIRVAYRYFFEVEPGLAVVGEAATGREALTEIPGCQPTLALVDISLDQMNGLELTRQLRAAMPELKILVVSNRSPSTWAERALRAGADGFLPKNRFEQDARRAIDQVLAGGTFTGGVPDQKRSAA